MSDYSPILLELSSCKSSLNRVARACRIGLAGKLEPLTDDGRNLSATVFSVEEAVARIERAMESFRLTLECTEHDWLPGCFGGTDGWKCSKCGAIQ